VADVLSPVETLRAAAAKLRKLAGNATPGEWYPDWDSGVYAMPNTAPKYVISGGNVTYDNTQWIALVHPGIAGPLAEMFDQIASAVDLDGDLIGRVGYGEALAVARVLLGVPDDPR